MTALLFADPAFRQRPASLHLSDLAFHAWFDTGPVGFIIGSYFGFLYSLLRLRSTKPSNHALQPTAGHCTKKVEG
jgi:hypothetical protein